MFLGKLHESFIDKRLSIFADIFDNTDGPIRILDVGGTQEFWKHNYPRDCKEIVLFNLFQQEAEPPFTCAVGDGCDLSRYGDNEFDIVFSNSTINLVNPYDNQMRMANEIRRVGKRYFVQMPNRNFPIDWRTLVPFFHFLPWQAQALCFRKMRVGVYRRTTDYEKSVILATRVHDLDYGELRKLFPDATILRENILGFTKSFMAVGNLA